MKELAKNIHSLAFRKFMYASDLSLYGKAEDWRSHISAVKEGKHFTDDCDGFALTCADLLLDSGALKSDVKLIVCYTETGEGHLVCGLDAEGTTWILDNRCRTIYDFRDRKDYTWVHFMVLSRPGVWFKVLNDHAL